MNDSGGRAESPLIRTDNDADDDPIPILPSPGFNVTENQIAQGREAISKQKSYPASGVNVSVKETDSEGNSMGVLYQSTIGSINGDQKDNRRNGDFFFPFLLRRAWVAPEQSSHQRHECGHVRSMYTRFLSVSTSDGYAVSGPRPRRVQFIRRTLKQPPSRIAAEPGLHVPRTAARAQQQQIALDRQSHRPVLHALLGQPAEPGPLLQHADPPPPHAARLATLRAQPAALFPFAHSPAVTPVCSPHAREKEKPAPQPSLQERVPTYIRDTILQHRVKPSWYSQLAAASAVRVPVLTPEVLEKEMELGGYASLA